MKSLIENISIKTFKDFYAFMDKFNFFQTTPEFEFDEETGVILLKAFSKNASELITVVFNGNGHFTLTHSSLKNLDLGATIFSLNENHKDDLKAYETVYKDFEISEDQIVKAILSELEKYGINDNDYLKVEKLFYFCYGWYLAIYNEQLVPNCKFEVWGDGPRINKIFHKLKYFSESSISSNDQIWNLTKDLPQDSNHLKVVQDLIEKYKHLSTEELIKLSKAKGTPWKEAFNNRQEEIPDNLIKKYFVELSEKAQQKTP